MGSWGYTYFAVGRGRVVGSGERILCRGGRWKRQSQAKLYDVSAELASGADAAYSCLAFSPIW